jgi:hypothetical protein
MAWCHIPEGLNPQQQHSENLRYCSIFYITSAFLIIFSDVACGLRMKLHLDLCSFIFISASDCTVLYITETKRYLLYLFIPRTEGAVQIKAITIFRCARLLTFYAVCVLAALTYLHLFQLRTTAVCCNPSFLRLLNYCIAMNKSNVHICSYLSYI